MEITQPYLPEDETLPTPDSQEFLEFDNSANDIEPEQPPNTPELAVEEKDFAKHAVEKRPEAVLPHVMNAAEQDKPLEAIYEKRAEVKDEQTPAQMVPIANVLADRPTPEPIYNQTPAPVPPPLYPITSPLADAPESKRNFVLTYKQSIRKGFTAGVAAAIVLLIIYFLIQN